MTRPRVLITAPRALPVLDRYVRELSAAGCEVLSAPSTERLEEADLLPLVGSIEGIICGDDRITRRVLDAAPQLRIIAKWGTGVDSIEVEDARQRGIVVSNSPGAFSAAVADTVMGYVLLFARRLDRMSADMHQGHWRRLPLVALSECTLGIVGFGASGRAVAQRARAFGMRVLVHTLDAVTPDQAADAGVTSGTLDQVLAESDFVTLHADLRKDNRHLIGPAQLRSMRPDAVLINTARGALVDETALVQGLQTGRIAGAALDVFEYEPLPADSPLRGMKNVYLAPHNANASAAAAEYVHRACIRSVIDVLGQRQPGA
jgi:D-3-phosphoglycerate dehydrogenase